MGWAGLTIMPIQGGSYRKFDCGRSFLAEWEVRMGRLLAIWLDGYDRTLADAMASELPSLSRLRERSARFSLEDGLTRFTGLTAEHVSSGLGPNDAERWSNIFFDKENYGIWEEGPLFAPFPSTMRANTVVFDFPFFDLARASNVCGAVAWGAHGAGMDFSTNPKELREEILQRHGAYPASQWIYGFAWPSAERCQAMGNALAEGAAARSELALWLLKERFPDWELALIGVSEAHCALEALWHGVDERHPLHSHSSSRVAAESVQKVYRAIDQLIGSLVEEFQDATILVFSMHGMGRNHSDVPGMVLLPELLHRYAFSRPFFEQPDSWARAANGLPILGKEEAWNVVTPDATWMMASVGERLVRRARGQAAKFLPKQVKQVVKRMVQPQKGEIGSQRQGQQAIDRRRKSLEWMPTARYQPLWDKMPAFALPSFHDGQIRLNLQGRERKGIVALDRYKACCEEIIQILIDSKDPFSGQPTVEKISMPHRGDPLRLAPSQADMYVAWNENVLCLEHPRLGRVGPVPFLRTGGHTGHYGMAYLKSEHLAPGEYGTRSSFNVVPTIFHVLDEDLPDKISGQSLV
jgi:hypothetical protein